jgi:septum formation protein
MELILASGSPRRSEILGGLGFSVVVDPPEVDETPFPDESPEAYTERLAREKALSVARRHPSSWVLAGDTVVVDRGAVLGKPVDESDAVSMLLRLQGRSHRVFSSLALVPPVTGGERQVRSGVSVTDVTFRPFDREVAEAYARTGEPLDKAGSYGIQGMGGALVEGIRGDYSGVVGLAVPLFIRLLEESGEPYLFGSAG